MQLKMNAFDTYKRAGAPALFLTVNQREDYAKKCLHPYINFFREQKFILWQKVELVSILSARKCANHTNALYEMFPTQPWHTEFCCIPYK